MTSSPGLHWGSRLQARRSVRPRQTTTTDTSDRYYSDKAGSQSVFKRT